jgi:hypothetical protein
MNKYSPFLKLCLLTIAVTIVKSNLWDNIYSQTHAKHPIVLDESFRLDFNIPEYDLKANIDYNN